MQQGSPRPALSVGPYWVSEFDAKSTNNASIDSSFPYQIPLDNKQSCDIFGAVCQPGTITVKSAVGNNRTTVVNIPCSSYLSAQSTFIRDSPMSKHLEWLRRYGRNPQCDSFASMLSSLPSTSPWTFTECHGSEATGTVDSNVSKAVPTQVPRHPVFPKLETCCGKCSFIILRVKLLYFPDPNAAAWCAARNRTMIYTDSRMNDTAHMKLRRRSPNLGASRVSLSTNVSTAVISGYTLWVNP